MKKLVVLVVVAIALAVAGSAMAFDLQGAAKDVGTKAVKAGAASGVNKELSKPNYQCQWNPKAKAVEKCDLNKIAAYLSGQKMAVEQAGKAAGSYTDYEVNVHAQDYKAYEKVKEQLKKFGVGSWDINHSTDNVKGNTITFSAIIQ